MKLNKLINRNFHHEPLLRLELLQLTNRVDELIKLMDVVEDDNSFYNLEYECDVIIAILEKSVKACKARDVGLKLVG